MKAIIIDDEPKNRELLELMLAEHCPTVRVVGSAAAITEGVRLTKSQKPDVVFLDIRLSRRDEGFTFFQNFTASKVGFDVVFVTAYEEFVLRAFNQTFAAGYLLKPVDADELVNIIFKIKQKQLAQRADTTLIDDAFPPNDIMFCYIKNETVRLRLADGRDKFARVNTLEDYEQHRNFVRTNRQFVVNLAFVNKIVDVADDGERLRTATAVLFNGDEISISVIRKAAFIKAFELFSL